MIQETKSDLLNYFRDKKVVVAFSGGVDSAVLLELALESAKEVLPVTIKSSLVPGSEIDFAIKYLEEKDLHFIVHYVNPLENEKVVHNDERRCYFCKKLIFESIIEATRYFSPDIIVEGSNVSDLSDYRPGLDAIKELKIKSPYLKLKITKSQIKELAEEMDLKVAKKPATTCLATRIPYGQQINEERLRRIEEAELIIKAVIGIEILRVRDHNEIARIEVSEDKIELFLDKKKRKAITEGLKNLGFSYITIDLVGYKQGSMNINIPGVEK
ncbi:MAG: ATP-dependent sacrificial sulfur transferase LarE [Candidatus Heimdallarchaeota archaeon]|nr:ATP-dependent sacrificial sulfur transferase LarE [Candidatus Heimdallarchaeota archaeon]